MSNGPEQDPTTEKKEAFIPAYKPPEVEPKTAEEIRAEYVAKRTAYAERATRDDQEIVDQLNAEKPPRSFMDKLRGLNKPYEATPVTERDIAEGEAMLENEAFDAEKAAEAADPLSPEQRSRIAELAELHSGGETMEEADERRRQEEIKKLEDKIKMQTVVVMRDRQRVQEIQEKLKTPISTQEKNDLQSELGMIKRVLPGTEDSLSGLNHEWGTLMKESEKARIFIDRLHVARAEKAAERAAVQAA
jgi:hypothetical protein